MAKADDQVADRLREKIVKGRWKPGSRIPSRVTLFKELGTCLATLQKAMDQLAAEGFVEVGPRKKGTRVASHPPHLTKYRLVFPYGPDDWGQFWHALEAGARQRSTPQQEFLCFYGLAGHRDIKEYQEIVREVETRRVAGLIFASSADEFLGTPLLDKPGLPRVAITGQGYLPGIPKVEIDLQSFMQQAVDTLVARGRTRIAMLSASIAGGMGDLFRRAMSAHGLKSRPAWEQFASRRNPLGARHVMELLMQSGQPERPDGLIVSDDNILTAAGEGLVAAGVRVPEDLHVVALTNFPLLVPSPVAVTRIGFDIPAMLDLLVQRLEQVRRGEKPPEFTFMPAKVEYH
ncbi:MAG: GntR family transcriptional regulator [Lentisphaerae bacterium]|nr:GntR family transcriptional regulator [Planctomycetota bacterium]MBM4144551.1 GntR family transcriptional regulator [Lentisphaerota bacterium]